MNMQTSFDITLAVQLVKKKEKLLLHFAMLTLYWAFTRNSGRPSLETNMIDLELWNSGRPSLETNMIDSELCNS